MPLSTTIDSKPLQREKALSPMEETLAMLDEEDFHVNEVLAFDGWTFAVRVALAPTSKVKSVELRLMPVGSTSCTKIFQS